MREFLSLRIVLFLCLLVFSCGVEKKVQTNAQHSLYGYFQRTLTSEYCQSSELLKINNNGTFSINIKERLNGKDSIYNCEGIYRICVDSNKTALFQTNNAQKQSSIDRMAYPIDGGLKKIELWNGHDVHIRIYSEDTLYDSYNAKPFVRIKPCL